MNRVAVVILNWNGADILDDCLESLTKQNYPAYQLIIVDNGSTDASLTVLDRWCQRCGEKLHVIESSQNLGFAGGVNVGIRYALENSFDAIALFNNDAVAEPNWLSALCEAMRTDDGIGIATGLFLHRDGQKIDSTGDWYSIWGLAFPRLRDEAAATAPNSGYVFGATGGASLYRTKMLEEIGLFDERFFAYYEDVDLSFRAQLTGWKVYYTNKALAYHDHGTTSGKIPGFSKYQMFKNLPILFWKNVPRGLLLKIGVRFFPIYFLMLINGIASGAVGPTLRGMLAAVRNLPYSFRHRQQIQRAKQVSAEYIDSILYQDLPPTQKGRLGRVIKFFTRS